MALIPLKPPVAFRKTVSRHLCQIFLSDLHRQWTALRGRTRVLHWFINARWSSCGCCEFRGARFSDLLPTRGALECFSIGLEQRNETNQNQDSKELRVFGNQPRVLIQSDQNQQPNTSAREPSLMQKTIYPNAESTSVKPNNGPVVFMRRYQIPYHVGSAFFKGHGT